MFTLIIILDKAKLVMYIACATQLSVSYVSTLCWAYAHCILHIARDLCIIANLYTSGLNCCDLFIFLCVIDYVGQQETGTAESKFASAPLTVNYRSL